MRYSRAELVSVILWIYRAEPECIIICGALGFAKERGRWAVKWSAINPTRLEVGHAIRDDAEETSPLHCQDDPVQLVARLQRVIPAS